jgi:hypothetical protein
MLFKRLCTSKESGISQISPMVSFLCKVSVLVSLPRRLAAVSIACRVSQEFGCDIGKTVGYEIGQQVRRLSHK